MKEPNRAVVAEAKRRMMLELEDPTFAKAGDNLHTLKDKCHVNITTRNQNDGGFSYD